MFWISKQILQLMMEDAIDDFLLRQIHWLRREDIIAQGIRWLQDVSKYIIILSCPHFTEMVFLAADRLIYSVG